MIADILKQINDAEAEADRIFARAKTKIADIEKDTLVKIDKINTDTDQEITAKLKELTPNVKIDAERAVISADKKKIDEAVKFILEQFNARFVK